MGHFRRLMYYDDDKRRRGFQWKSFESMRERKKNECRHGDEAVCRIVLDQYIEPLRRLAQVRTEVSIRKREREKKKDFCCMEMVFSFWAAAEKKNVGGLWLLPAGAQ